MLQMNDQRIENRLENGALFLILIGFLNFWLFAEVYRKIRTMIKNKYL